MSSSTSIIYGRGFATGSISLKTVLQFMQNHIESLTNPDFDCSKYSTTVADIVYGCDLSKLPDDFTPYDDVPEDAHLDIEKLFDALNKILKVEQAEDHYAFVIARIINIENPGAALQYEIAQSDECEGEPSILLAESLPWNMTAFQRTVFSSIDTFDKFLKPYLDELGLEPYCIDDIKIEYYG